MQKSYLLILLALIPVTVFAASVRLKWDANKETNLAGYKVYFRNATSANYQLYSTIRPPATNAVLHNLSSGGKYIAAITAFNNYSQESNRSNRVGIGFPEIKVRAALKGRVMGVPLSQVYD